MKNKVFFIGEPKTGTKSIAKALKTLGVNTIHDSKRFRKSYSKGDYLIKKHIDEADAFLDGPFRYYYKELNEEYDAKFIYSTREITSWIISLVNHRIRRGRELDFNFIYESIVNSLENKRKILNYFQDCSNFMVFDISDNKNNWKELINFLELDIEFDVSTSFPRRGSKRATQTIQQFSDLEFYYGFKEQDFFKSIQNYEDIINF